MNSPSQPDHTLQGCEIIIGVSGGIAAYKTADLVSKLAQAGVGVQVVMTQAATHFVGEATFQALTGRRVVTQVLGDGEYPLGAHVELAAKASLLCVHRQLPTTWRRPPTVMPMTCLQHSRLLLREPS